MYKEFDTIEDLYQWIEEDKTGRERKRINQPLPSTFVLSKISTTSVHLLTNVRIIACLYKVWKAGWQKDAMTKC